MGIGLGLAAGAVLYSAGAQGVDTSKVRRDSTARRDSAALKPVPPPDTIKAPLARADAPRLLASDSALHYDRAQMFATGALTLQDLLARELIITPFTVGYISAPQNAAVAGDFRRVRVFIDGVEYDALDTRSNGIVDYSQIPLWSAEDVTIERTASEVRVHIRTWRVDHTASYTRTDIGTGDQQLNLYRGFFGRRFDNGAALQLGAQQYGTSPPSYLGSSADQLGLIGRVGWAGKTFSVDAFMARVSRHRGDIFAYGRRDTLPGLESTRMDTYLRAGLRDADTSALWARAVISHAAYDFKPPSAASALGATTATDTVNRDTTQAQLQYVATIGTNRGPLRLSATARVRHADTVTLFTPLLSGSYAQGGLSVRGNLEGKSTDSLSRADVIGEFALGRIFRVGAAIDRAVDHRKAADGLKTVGTRAWGGVRLGTLWLDGGIIRRDSAVLVAPTLIGANDSLVFSRAAAGLTLRGSGRIWKSIYADLNAVRWKDTTALYRPQYQTRAEVFVRTSLLKRFPTNNFGLLFSVRHEYRSASLIPVSPDTLRASGVHDLAGLLEIRIYGAVVSWQVRDMIGTRNYQAADYLMPRTTNFYGVRWEFWN